MSPVKNVVVTWKFDDVTAMTVAGIGADGWYPVGTVTLDVPMRRSQIRHLWRWVRYPDQAPTKRPVPLKGRR